MNGELLLQSLVKGETQVPAASEDLADAITHLVDSYSRELATSGMSGPEVEVEAAEMVAEAVGLPQEEIRRQVAGSRIREDDGPV